ncbi:CaiB/BaiF CoA transferase family protein [Mesorhizobium amorphae]|uniref:Alpha-methylacyl-CoA racemase n=1 Tax=Mesorhizobium amorphae CCNWGS0123 TaxID=1082933 RepID=G6Y3F9_9HYPH|nr:CaiB/BaiF CoA-transferase family protein [Mesorhizobium amorphae]ANT54889.1 CoA-transferase [Mesorhizobium amorphae CCNWGS0123]EHH13726.1 alpha-methylacyl-CoA racemase [Mesorhizobium amorphae CCNWGS0123]
MGVLSGVKIIEIAGLGPGPFCGMLLADLGADVISIERPDADVGAPRPWAVCSRGKRSIVLDLKKPAAVETVLQLVENADALIEGMRPGVMERLGLGPEVCHARCSSLVYGRMTGWGQNGPLVQAAGHDGNYTGISGALWLATPPGQAPEGPPTLLGDVAGGALYLAVGILAGILRARQDGRGQVVDAAMIDGSAHLLNLAISFIHLDLGGEFARGKPTASGMFWDRAYQCADGEWVVIQPVEPHFYAELIRRLGFDNDQRFVNGQRTPELWATLGNELAEHFKTKTRAEWTALLEGTDSCFAPVLSPEEAASHPQVIARGIYKRIDNVLQAAPAPRFSLTPSPELGSVPPRGAHTEEILAELGLGRSSARG